MAPGEDGSGDREASRDDGAAVPNSRDTGSWERAVEGWRQGCLLFANYPAVEGKGAPRENKAVF